MSNNFQQQLAYLPDYLGQHLTISIIALLAGIAIILPLAVAIRKMPRTRWLVLTTAGMIQTIPSLALLGALFLLIQNFYWPVIIGLTLYSMLPILRNTVTGINGIDPALKWGTSQIFWESVRLMNVDLQEDKSRELWF